MCYRKFRGYKRNNKRGNKKFDDIFNEFQHEENIKQIIFFEGQIFDAYSLIIDLIKKAKNKIIIIDNYIYIICIIFIFLVNNTKKWFYAKE